MAVLDGALLRVDQTVGSIAQLAPVFPLLVDHLEAQACPLEVLLSDISSTISRPPRSHPQ